MNNAIIWNFEDAVKMFWNAKYHPDYAPSLEGVPSAIKDVLIASVCNHPNLFSRHDWLRSLQFVSPENREGALHLVVYRRMEIDKNSPGWIFLACQYAQQEGWEIPVSWIETLRSFLSVTKEAMNEAGYYTNDHWYSSGKEWLEAWDAKKEDK